MLMTEVEDKVLDTIKRTEAAVLQSLKQWNGKVDGVVPDGLKTEVPDPSELVDSAFDFAQRVMASQRDFVASLFDTLKAKES